jgi:hypothetical protein
MIKDRRTLEDLRTFFATLMVPLADRLRREGAPLLTTGSDPKAASYYVVRTKRTMSKADFEWGGSTSATEFRDNLAQLWRDQGCDALAGLAPQFADFAERLRDIETENEEVSPFIYAMY